MPSLPSPAKKTKQQFALHEIFPQKSPTGFKQQHFALQDAPQFSDGLRRIQQ